MIFVQADLVAGHTGLDAGASERSDSGLGRFVLNVWKISLRTVRGGARLRQFSRRALVSYGRDQSERSPSQVLRNRLRLGSGRAGKSLLLLYD